MTKTLDTLVQDIYTTLEQGVDVSQPSVQEALDEWQLGAKGAETVLREESVQVHLTYDSLKSENQTVKSGTVQEKKESLSVDRPVLSS